MTREETFPAPDCEGLYTGRVRAVAQGVVLDQAEASFKVTESQPTGTDGVVILTYERV